MCCIRQQQTLKLHISAAVQDFVTAAVLTPIPTLSRTSIKMVGFSPLFAIALCVCGAWSIDPEKIAERYKASLLNKTQIDWKNPPYGDTMTRNTTCPYYWWKCQKAAFVVRQTLLELPAPLNHSLAVVNDAIPQRRYLNHDSASVTMHSEDSTWITTGSSQSANIGASVSKAGIITVSGGYSYDQHESTTRIASLSISQNCPPGHECRFETWVYHVQYSGQCKRQAMVDCGGEMDTCPLIANTFLLTPNNAPDGLRCRIYTDWILDQCRYPGGLQIEKHPTGNCTFRRPINEASGKPLWTLVFVKEDYRGSVKDDQSDVSGPDLYTKSDGTSSRPNPPAVNPEEGCLEYPEFATHEELSKDLCKCIPGFNGDKSHCASDTGTKSSTKKRMGIKSSLSRRSAAPKNIEVTVVAGFKIEGLDS
ncbi:hypothetical protein CDD80_5895 [Ophiocordyceps camponoti-rufipedis]|uniref:Uncharacterized protein n=1 Tax=Ophiocordyceps camponoti-rufipedis TaxID=2004952 RepID=A0A2C5YM68_9HYPO|nr:hypothetical protein CDD80_5895 [Ophiocordyceps camponoti-rufipedis]